MAVGEAWAINGATGAPEYTAAELRRIIAALLPQGQADRVGAREGIRPGSQAVTLASTTVTVHRHCGVVYPGLTSASGPYPYEMGEGTHTLDPADGSQARIDAIDIQLQDQDEDGSGQRRVRSVYVVGTPGSPPLEPSLTANAFRAALVDVPADGTGSPSLTYVAPWTVASGGIIPVRDSSELPTAGLYDGLAAYNQDTRELLVREDGSWVNVRHEEVVADQQSTSPTNLGGNELTIVSTDLVIPPPWNGWRVSWQATFAIDNGTPSANRSLTLRVRHGSTSGTLLSQEPATTVTVTPAQNVISVTGGAQGLSGTGSQTIRVTGQLGTNDDYQHLSRQIHVRAVRTS